MEKSYLCEKLQNILYKISYIHLQKYCIKAYRCRATGGSIFVLGDQHGNEIHLIKGRDYPA